MKSSELKVGIVLKQYRSVIFKEVFRKSIHLCSALFLRFWLFRTGRL